MVCGQLGSRTGNKVVMKIEAILHSKQRKQNREEAWKEWLLAIRAARLFERARVGKRYKTVHQELGAVF